MADYNEIGAIRVWVDEVAASAAEIDLSVTILGNQGDYRESPLFLAPRVDVGLAVPIPRLLEELLYVAGSIRSSYGYQPAVHRSVVLEEVLGVEVP